MHLTVAFLYAIVFDVSVAYPGQGVTFQTSDVIRCDQIFVVELVFEDREFFLRMGEERLLFQSFAMFDTHLDVFW
jgi:hypothetical protein